MWPAAKFSNSDFLFPLALLYLFIGILLQERVVSSPFICLWTYFAGSVWTNEYLLYSLDYNSIITLLPKLFSVWSLGPLSVWLLPFWHTPSFRGNTPWLWALQGSPGSFCVLLAPAMDSAIPSKPKSPRPGHFVCSLLPGRHSSQRTELRNIYIYIPPNVYTHVYLCLYVSLCILFLKHHNVHSSLPPFLSCNFPLIVRKLALFIANKFVQPSSAYKVASELLTP